MTAPIVEFLLGLYFLGAVLPALFTPVPAGTSRLPVFVQLLFAAVLLLLAFLGGVQFIS